MPNVFLEDTTKYALFTDNGTYYITFQGRMDNGGRSPIESDSVDGVARGFFLQDMTYGFDSLDGFTVAYQTSSNSWTTNSMIITK